MNAWCAQVMKKVAPTKKMSPAAVLVVTDMLVYGADLQNRN